MKDALRHQLQRLAMRLAELDAHLADPTLTQDIQRYRSVAREQAEAGQIVVRFNHHEQRLADLATARSLLSDPEMSEMAQEEIASAEADIVRLLAELQAALLPRDPDDGRNAFLEIRAGSGGDESALFGGDLARMYLRYSERRGWRTEILSESASDLGGYKELVLRIEGDGVYSRLKFESGGHRVQRVPQTESQGRIHSSACTVAVMAEPDVAAEVAINLPSCASTPSAPAAPAASTSTRPTARSASRTCRPASSPSARTTARSTATRPRRWPC